LTNILQFDIITPALREGTKKVSERNAIANLENDTEKREKGLERRCEEPGNRGASRGEETVRFEELNAVKLEETECFGEREVEDSGTEKD